MTMSNSNFNPNSSDATFALLLSKLEDQGRQIVSNHLEVINRFDSVARDLKNDQRAHEAKAGIVEKELASRISRVENRVACWAGALAAFGVVLKLIFR